MMSMPHKARDYSMTVIVNESLHCNNGLEGMVYKLAACVNDQFARLFENHDFLSRRKRFSHCCHMSCHDVPKASCQ